MLLLPRHDGDFGRIGVVAEVIERGQLPNGGWAATVVGLHRGLAGAAQPTGGDQLRVEVQELHGGNPEDERSNELVREYTAPWSRRSSSCAAPTSASPHSCARSSRGAGRHRWLQPRSRASRS